MLKKESLEGPDMKEKNNSITDDYATEAQKEENIYEGESPEYDRSDSMPQQQTAKPRIDAIDDTYDSVEARQGPSCPASNEIYERVEGFEH